MNSNIKSQSSGIYPAKDHAQKVYKTFVNFQKGAGGIFLSGNVLELYDYSDQTRPFRQNRYFFYLSGCEIPGSHVLYIADSKKLLLFLPNVDQEDTLWSGPSISPGDALRRYDVDEVIYEDKLYEYLKKFKDRDIFIHSLKLNKSSFPFKDVLIESESDLKYALDESRLIKDHFEISLMKRAAAITDNCHLAVMSATKIETNETHIHAEFMYHALRQGSKYQSYDPICCTGPNCSTLHYVANDEDIGDRNSVLIDAGAEWSCYASDVTRCFPINGDWTKEHLEIYNTVLKMQKVTMSMIKPGASWDDIHLEAHRVLTREFLKLGIFKDASESVLFDSDITTRFFPHGLGHLLGMDTHDVGGNPNFEDSNQKLKYLRLRRKLQKGMVVTNEPGVYFSPLLLKDVLSEASTAQFIDEAVLYKYWCVGGVRIEDDLLITEDGFENLTQITSDPEEISKIIKGSSSGGKDRFHVIV